MSLLQGEIMQCHAGYSSTTHNRSKRASAPQAEKLATPADSPQFSLESRGQKHEAGMLCPVSEGNAEPFSRFLLTVSLQRLFLLTVIALIEKRRRKG